MPLHQYVVTVPWTQGKKEGRELSDYAGFDQATALGEGEEAVSQCGQHGLLEVIVDGVIKDIKS